MRSLDEPIADCSEVVIVPTWAALGLAGKGMGGQ
jgi:hypothetical protein